MKNVTGSVERQGNLDTSDAQVLGISEAGLDVLRMLLSNMYSNATLAVIREYSCNARDAMVDAGRGDEPIQVTLPDRMNPTLIIQDFGTGLTADEVVRIFGTYGESTKRESNDQVGAFGIGSKSAFTLGHQFFVSAVKDGRKTVALFALNEKDQPTVQILSDTETTDANGVTVTLPVDDVDTMRSEAYSFFRTWRPGTVLVNKQQPESVYDHGFDITDEIHIDPEHSGYGDSVYVIMGGVAYPVSDDILRKAANQVADDKTATEIAGQLRGWGGPSVYFDVEIGSVNLAPSREALRDTPATIATVAERLVALGNALWQSVEDKISNADSWIEAVRTKASMHDMLKGFKLDLGNLKWQGNDLGKARVDLPLVQLVSKSSRSNKTDVQVVRPALHDVVKRDSKGNIVYDAKGDREMEKVRTTYSDLTIGTHDSGTVLVVHVHPSDEAKVTRYARRFIENRDGVEVLYLSDKVKGKFDWFSFGHKGDTVEVISLDDYRQFLKDTAPTAERRRYTSDPRYSFREVKSGTYYDRTPDRDPEMRTPLSEILEAAGDEPVVLFDSEAPYGDALVLDALKDKPVMITLPTQSFDKACKNIEERDGTWVYGFDVIKAHAKTVLASMTQAEKDALANEDLFEKAYDRNYRWVASAVDPWDDIKRILGKDIEQVENDRFRAVMETLEALEEGHKVMDGARGSMLTLAAQRCGKDLPKGTKAVLPDLAEEFPILSAVASAKRNGNLNREEGVRKGLLTTDLVIYLNAS